MRSLHVAFDQGIWYFDTAPIYGYGWAEHILGEFVKDKRQDLILATKMGLEPHPLLSHLPFGVVRGIRTLTKIRRSSVSGIIPAGTTQYTETTMDIVRTRKSLEQSLRRLKTDSVDILLLHEGTIDYANQEELLKFLEEVLSSGKAKEVGIGSSIEKLQNIEALSKLYRVIQTDFSLVSTLPPTDIPRLTNVYGVLKAVKFLLGQSNRPELRNEMINACGLDIQSSADALRLSLGIARYTNPNGVTIFSSSHENHIRDMISIWNQNEINDQALLNSISILKSYST